MLRFYNAAADARSAATTTARSAATTTARGATATTARSAAATTVRSATATSRNRIARIFRNVVSKYRYLAILQVWILVGVQGIGQNGDRGKTCSKPICAGLQYLLNGG